MPFDRLDSSKFLAAALLTAGLLSCNSGGGDSESSDTRPLKLEARPTNLDCVAPATGNLVATALSGTGCFDDTASHQVADGVISYTVNNLLWTDGEKKGRYFAIPDGTTIGLLDDGHFDFPAGSVVIKTFSHAGTRMETRLMMNHATDGWVGYAYKWTSDQSEANLLFDSDTVTVGSYDHRIPSPDECMECHLVDDDSAYAAIGNETLQQNYDQTYSNGETENFLDALDRLGFFTAPLDPNFKLNRLSAIGDTGVSVEERARSYLHANCSGCHRPGTGGSVGTGHNFRYGATLDQALCGWDSGPFPGSGSTPKVIDPGDSENSAVIGRMGTNDPDFMMPPIGRATVDEEALLVMRNWIDSLVNCD